MQSAIFDTPVLKVDSLLTKFDTIVLSNSFVALIGDYIEARILQQLHYWCYSEYGVVIDGLRWIYKPIGEWLSEAFIGFTSWQLRKAIASLLEKELISREKLFTKHQIQLGDRFWWQPKNQTYYYSLNYDKIRELIDRVENDGAFKDSNSIRVPAPPETPENIRFVSDTKLSVEDSKTTKFCESTQNNTKNTSIEDNSKEKSHPTLPEGEWESSKPINQGKDCPHTSELPSTSEETKDNGSQQKAVEREISSADVELEINQNKGTVQDDVQDDIRNDVRNDVRDNVRVDDDTYHRTSRAGETSCGGDTVETKTIKTKEEGTGKREQERCEKTSDSKREAAVNSAVSRPKPKVSQKTKTKRSKKAPWKDEEQFKRFYGELVRALPIVANSHSPQGLAQTIIKQLRSGTPHSYWDDFAAGVPIGTSTKPEWEIEPGVPYPMFIEYLTEKLKAGNNSTSDEQTRNEVFRILSKPRQAKAFWGQFKLSVVNVASRIESDLSLGVSNPNTPVWTRERIEPSIEEAAAAGKKIVATNHTAQNAIAAADNPQLESKPSSLESENPELEKAQAEMSRSTQEIASRANNPQLESKPSSLESENPELETSRSTREIASPATNPHQISEESSPNERLSRPENPQPERQSVNTNEEISDPWTDEGEGASSEVEGVGDSHRDEKPQQSMRELLTEKLGDRNLKGFVKQMPKVSQDEAEAEIEALSRQRMNRKIHIDRMSIDEINQFLADPIMRRELTPQIIFNDKFDIVTDNLGEILAVKINREYLNNGGT